MLRWALARMLMGIRLDPVPAHKGLQENSFLPTLMLVPGTLTSVAPPSPTLTPTAGPGAATETLVPGALTLTWVSLRPSPAYQTAIVSFYSPTAVFRDHICSAAWLSADAGKLSVELGAKTRDQAAMQELCSLGEAQSLSPVAGWVSAS